VSGHYGWSGPMETIEEEIRRNGIDPHEVTVAHLAPGLIRWASRPPQARASTRVFSTALTGLVWGQTFSETWSKAGFALPWACLNVCSRWSTTSVVVGRRP